MIVALILAAALQQAASNTAGPPASTPAAASPRAPAGSDVVCHPGPASGRIAGPPVCHRRDEWEAMVQNATGGAGRGASQGACRHGMMMGC